VGALSIRCWGHRRALRAALWRIAQVLPCVRAGGAGPWVARQSYLGPGNRALPRQQQLAAPSSESWPAVGLCIAACQLALHVQRGFPELGSLAYLFLLSWELAVI
jgi:hypothetical protein